MPIHKVITRIVLAYGLITCLGLAGQAQQLEVGLKAGINICSQRFAGNGLPSGIQSLTGFHVGIYSIIPYSAHISFQPEVLLSTCGVKLDYSGTGYEDTFTYVSVPLLVRYKISERIQLHGGPQVGILCSAKETSGGSSFDTRNDFKNGDFSLVLGAGIDLPLKFNLAARYSFGISDVDKIGDESTKNSAFQLSVGYRVF